MSKEKPSLVTKSYPKGTLLKTVKEDARKEKEEKNRKKSIANVIELTQQEQLRRVAAKEAENKEAQENSKKRRLIVKNLIEAERQRQIENMAAKAAENAAAYNKEKRNRAEQVVKVIKLQEEERQRLIAEKEERNQEERNQEVKNRTLRRLSRKMRFNVEEKEAAAAERKAAENVAKREAAEQDKKEQNEAHKQEKKELDNLRLMSVIAAPIALIGIVLTVLAFTTPLFKSGFRDMTETEINPITVTILFILVVLIFFK